MLRPFYYKCFFLFGATWFSKYFFSKSRCNLKVRRIKLKVACNEWWQTWSWIRSHLTSTLTIANQAYFQFKKNLNSAVKYTSICLQNVISYMYNLGFFLKWFAWEKKSIFIEIYKWINIWKLTFYSFLIQNQYQSLYMYLLWNRPHHITASSRFLEFMTRIFFFLHILLYGEMNDFWVMKGLMILIIFNFF